MGLQATPDGIQQAKVALKGMQLNQTTLATRLDLTVQPISKFFTAKRVSDKNFVKICETLKLDWQVIAGMVSPPAPKFWGL